MHLPPTSQDIGSTAETVEYRPRNGAAILRRIFRATLLDEIERRKGGSIKPVFKAEKVLRRLIAGTISGDPASIAGLIVVAQVTGEFDEAFHESNSAAVLLRWLGDADPSRPADRG